jgi:UDP-glucuronate 4-epimerase
MHYIEVLEKRLGRKAQMNLLPLQPGDVPDTYADVSDLARDTAYHPDTAVEEGVARFVDWYLGYYGVRE